MIEVLTPVRPDPRLVVGQLLAGRYWLQEHLGRGAAGDVFRARHARVPRTFAIKVLHPELVSNPKACSRFEREAELAARLRHRNVVGVIDVGETARSRYLVMEFAEGVSLGDVMNCQPMAERRVIALAKQICDGLQHAHDHDLVHRDLKPENIIVERTQTDEIPRIVDFGLAVLRAGGGERLTTDGIVLGTPHYLAPESALHDMVDHRADLFALGVIMFEMLTGVMPHDGDGVAVARANVTAPTPAMADRAPRVVVDPLLEALVARLMAKDPDDRPHSAREVRSLLEMIQSDRVSATFLLGPDNEAHHAQAEDSEPIELVIRARAKTVEPVVPVVDEGAPPNAFDFEYAPSEPMPVGHARGGTIEPVVLPYDPRTTEELLALTEPARGGIVWKLAAAVLMLGIAVGTIAIAMQDEGSDTARIEIVDQPATPSAPSASSASSAPSTPTIPVPSASVESPAPTPAKVSPRVAKPAPAPTPAAEVGGVATEQVVRLYASLGRELKTIADRRDMAVDDLWQRYRRIRIQTAIQTSTDRAVAMNELAYIERQLAARFTHAP